MTTSTQVDFYIIDTPSALGAWRFACEWLEKAYEKNNPIIYVHAESKADAEKLDDLLWTYRDDSFIPHQIFSPAQSESPNILIGYNGATPSYTASDQPILVNLSSQLAEPYALCPEIIEIVFNDPTMQQLARERFKHYRQLGYQLNTHKLKPS